MSTPMSLGALRAEVLAHGFDPIGFGSARVNQFLNDALGRVCRRVNYSQQETTSDFSTVAGTASYTRPADFVRARWLTDLSVPRELAPVSLQMMDRFAPTQAQPTCFAADMQGLRLYPIPDAVYPLELRYWKTPAAMVADTDVPPIPADYHRMLWYWACKECYVAEDDAQMAQYWEQQFNTTLTEFSADVKFPLPDSARELAGSEGPLTVNYRFWS